ncbi:MAG: DUF3427 domain-containing protein [Eubacteriales bacterium]|nr:DUF3427 domain-containing protein [Eubacteriales bacterium]
MIHSGIYEQLVNKQLKEELNQIPEDRKSIEKVDEAEASSIISDYVSKILKKGLDDVLSAGGDIANQIDLANEIVEIVKRQTAVEEVDDLKLESPANQLMALINERDPSLAVGKTAKDMPRPETSIARSSLFTNAKHEPSLVVELKKEIRSADHIDFLVSFIKWSGLVKIIDDLREFTQSGGKLRVITTTYMGASDSKAIEELSKLPNTVVKISYVTKSTRLHAKMYAFYRDNGYSTAYVGSSNLSNAAISSGLEWNVKLTATDMPETMNKIEATFENYWNADDFEVYGGTEEELHKLIELLNEEKKRDSFDFFFDIKPYPYQQEILDKLKAEREIRQHYKNLVVAATGTGKTVISALDYRNYCNAHKGEKNKLLFVAHREEILQQSLKTFQMVMKDNNFGELYVGGHKPESIDHLFASIQTINSRNLCETLASNYYDFIIVDEFHHAAALTYDKMLKHFKPKVLVGLTATPERMDGKSILEWFDGRIAAEIRLPEAIERRLLCPFQYFGVSDSVDLSELRWTRGGYDKSELENVYVASRESARRRAGDIILAMQRYVASMDDVKALGFCVSVKHAEFMTEFFNENGIPSLYVTGETDDNTRKNSKAMLEAGKVKVIFTVDLYNEGVDIVPLNTVLFLRPTESLTIFLQQLGRGLRLSEGKDCLTVLDFIGQANKNYRFEEKFKALLQPGSGSLNKEIRDEFPSVPHGCYIQLEKKAARVILENINAATGKQKWLVSRIESFKDDTGRDITLTNFLNYYHLEPKDIYHTESFSALCEIAEVRGAYSEPLKEIAKTALYRLSNIDSRRWIGFLRELLPQLKEFVDAPEMFETLNGYEKRMLQMFYITVWNKSAISWDDAEAIKNLKSLVDSKVFISELLELLNYKFDQIDLIDSNADLGFDCPLDLYCTYSRDQILVAMDYMTPSNVREGVKWLPEKQMDVFFITLNKSDKEYSPTTMYNDYSISDSLFHWQSQSTTSADSKTGQRYINHAANGSRICLFVRERKKDFHGGTESYTFLGLADYVRHEGSRPMNIVWRMEERIPAKFLHTTSQGLVG